MNKPFIEIDAENLTISAFETKPIEGYEAPINKETGEQFPNCCPFHKSVFEWAESWFSKFPNCCDQHKEFIGKWWFKKENYNGIAEKIVKQLSYTEHHISERINIDDWYKDITDYIEYNVSSFGHPAIGLGLYLKNIQYYIENAKDEIPKSKGQRLIEFIGTYYNSPIDIDETNKTDLNILYSTYQKWLKVFPFEISFFANLKPHFEGRLPILNSKPEVNKYTGRAKAKAHTKGSLVDVLLNLTNSLLTKINTTALYKNGLLTEPQKIKLELVLNEREMELKQGYINNSKDEEQRYRKILKKWFEDEKRFIDEVTSVLKALPPQQPETVKPDEAYKTQLLFKVGLLFAKGEMNKYFTVNSKGTTVMNGGFSALKIAKEIGNESYNKYILATINNYTPDKENGSKNIFNSPDMMSKIIACCEAENIAVDAYFRSRLPIE